MHVASACSGGDNSRVEGGGGVVRTAHVREVGDVTGAEDAVGTRLEVLVHLRHEQVGTCSIIMKGSSGDAGVSAR